MDLKKLLLSTVLGVGAAMTLASAAIAAPVVVRDAQPADSSPFASAGLFQSVSIRVQGMNSNAFFNQNAGAFGLEQATNSPQFNNFTSLITYCIEIGQSLGFNSLPATYQSMALATALSSNIPASPDAAAAADKIRRLWADSFAASVDVNSSDFEGLTGISTSERAAAFQVAIWEIAVDNGDGLGVGDFRAAQGSVGSSQRDVYDLAALYVAIANSNRTPLANIEALASDTRQNLIRPSGGPSGAEVPAPASLALFGAGLVALAAMRRRTNA